MPNSLDDVGKPPSYSTAVAFDQKVAVVSFGDGYEQRAPTGINSKRLSFQLVWDRRKSTTVAAVLAFFGGQGSSNAFLWTPPAPYNAAPFSDGAPLQWIARLPGTHTLDGYDMETLTVQIDQDFNPLP